MGLSSSKQKTSSRSTTTPNVPAWITTPYQNFATQLGAVTNGANAGPSLTPASALQTQAFTNAGGLGGPNAGLTEGMDATRGLLNFTPDNVQAGQLADTDLSPYMNPWTQSVIDASMADIERARAGAISAGQGAATQAGAFGGSRHGVMDAGTNEAALRTGANTSATLRSQGFGQAQQAASADIAARYAADSGNADRALQGAGLRLGSAEQMARLGLASDESRRADIGLQGLLGEQQRDVDMQNNPREAEMRRLAQIASLLGVFQGYPIGNTTNSSGTTTSTPSGLQVLGSIAQTASALFPSDRRLKRNIEYSHTDAKGLRWYSYDYVWGGPPQLGVMADEAPAHAVHMHPSGYAMVDYGAL